MQFGPPISDTVNNRCLFEVLFDVVIPLVPPFLLFQPSKIQKTDCNSTFELNFEQAAPVFNAGRWEQKITPLVYLPDLLEIEGGTVEVEGGLGSGRFEITGTKCNQKINLILNLNTTACATSGGGGGAKSCAETTDCSGTCPAGQDCSMAGGSGGSACGCVSLSLAAAIASGIDFCHDPNYVCPEDAALVCPPGSRCNPHIDF